MARRGNRNARQTGTSDASQTLPAPNYITRELPYIELASEQQLTLIEQQADWILQEVGLEFPDSPHARHVWQKAGATVTGTRVKIPRGMARDYCKTAPAQFVQKAKNPDFDVVIGGMRARF